MNSSIKDTIEIKSIKTYKEVGYDEDRTMIAFEPADLRSTINRVIQVCADQVTDSEERARILSLGE